MEDLPWWLFLLSLSPDLILSVLIGLLALLVVGAVAGYIVYRRLRRHPAWSRGWLLLRARYEGPGPWRDVDLLRVRVADAIDAARRGLELPRSERPIGELGSLYARAERTAQQLDAQLRMMSSESDGRVLRGLLATARTRVEELEGIARRLRDAAALQVESPMSDELATLGSDADRELQALRSGVEELRRLGASESGLTSPDSRRAAAAGRRRS